MQGPRSANTASSAVCNVSAPSRGAHAAPSQVARGAHTAQSAHRNVNRAAPTPPAAPRALHSPRLHSPRPAGNQHAEAGTARSASLVSYIKEESCFSRVHGVHRGGNGASPDGRRAALNAAVLCADAPLARLRSLPATLALRARELLRVNGVCAESTLRYLHVGPERSASSQRAWRKTPFISGTPTSGRLSTTQRRKRRRAVQDADAVAGGVDKWRDQRARFRGMRRAPVRRDRDDVTHCARR